MAATCPTPDTEWSHKLQPPLVIHTLLARLAGTGFVIFLLVKVIGTANSLRKGQWLGYERRNDSRRRKGITPMALDTMDIRTTRKVTALGDSYWKPVAAIDTMTRIVEMLRNRAHRVARPSHYKNINK